MISERLLRLEDQLKPEGKGSSLRSGKLNGEERNRGIKRKGQEEEDKSS